MADNAWTLQPDELSLLLNLTKARGIGPMKIRKLIHAFGSPSGILEASPKQLHRMPQIGSSIISELQHIKSLDFGTTQIAQCRSAGVQIISLWDARYPALLKKIDDPPVFLFVKGDLSILENPALAIVGTRSPSEYGKQVAEKLVADLVAKNFVTVSGFARGIDTIVHAVTIKRGGLTAAVVGCGLDVIYPPENKKLAQALPSQGVFISEFPMGTKPDAMNFPRRNRIISGLSLGTIIVEARKKSGALITANLALEQNREVFAIPGSIFSPLSQGPHELIKEGAKLVFSIDDILEEVSVQGRLFSRQTMMAADTAKLDAREKRVFVALTEQPIHIDQLAAEVGMSTAELLGVLLQLEFSGLVRQMPGKLFSRL